MHMKRAVAMAVPTLILGATWTLVGCPTNKGNSAERVSQARSSLAEREHKLIAYSFSGTTTDLASNQSLSYQFTYRSPNKMRGELLGEQPHTFVFDGKQLSELAPLDKKVLRYDLSALPRAKADVFLHQIFEPFAPEGFRTPLLPTGPSVTAKDVEDAHGKAQLELGADLEESGEHFQFAFDFVPGSMDLVRKKVTGPTGVVITEVTVQHCDAALGLCFPQEITEQRDGKPSAKTVLTAVQINPAVAEDLFTLATPAGFTEEQKHLATSQ
jgi:outer membrane lipoprotein-sorting protein